MKLFGASLGLACCLVGSCLLAQEDGDAGVNVGWHMERELMECEYDVECIWKRGQALQSRDAYFSDCDSMLVADFLVLHAKILWAGALDASAFRKSTCGTRGAPLWYAFGHLAQLEGALDSARTCFEQALRSAGPDGLYIEYPSAQALGAVCNLLGDFTASVEAFEHAHDLDPLRGSPNDLNNYAAVNLSLGNCEEAWKWLDAAQELAKQGTGSNSNSSAFEDFQNVLQLSRMQVAMSAMDLDLALEFLKDVDFSNSFEGRELIASMIVSSLCIERNDRLLFEGLRPRLAGFVEGSDSLEALEVLGAYSLLFEPWAKGEWTANWERIRSLPPLVRGSLMGNCSSTLPADQEGFEAGDRSVWQGGTAGGTTCALVLGMMLWRRSRRQRDLAKLEKGKLSEWRDVVGCSLDGSAGDMTPGDRLRMARALRLLLDRKTERTVAHLPGWESCSLVERQLAVGLAQGDQTKQIAIRLAISTSYAYNLRSQVRQKLNAPDGESLDRWLQTQAR